MQQIAEHSLYKPERLFIATKYSLLNNGKRLRPALVYAVVNLFNIELTKLNAAAASVELIHCYSLIHDDLPAMDDDDFRRGQPSCHKAFDQATAILVGDGLQSLAFQILSDQEINPFNANIRSNMVLSLSKAAGLLGMVYGQATDMDSSNKIISLKDLETMHAHKTGGLINCCFELAMLALQEKKYDNIDEQNNKIIKQ